VRPAALQTPEALKTPEALQTREALATPEALETPEGLETPEALHNPEAGILGAPETRAARRTRRVLENSPAQETGVRERGVRETGVRETGVREIRPVQETTGGQVRAVTSGHATSVATACPDSSASTGRCERVT
jgi:hypothetical protein